MKFDIDWDTVEEIGTEYVKHSYVMLLHVIQNCNPDNNDHQKELMKNVTRVECFETVLKHILPEGESQAFITEQRQKHFSQPQGETK